MVGRSFGGFVRRRRGRLLEDPNISNTVPKTERHRPKTIGFPVWLKAVRSASKGRYDRMSGNVERLLAGRTSPHLNLFRISDPRNRESETGSQYASYLRPFGLRGRRTHVSICFVLASQFRKCRVTKAPGDGGSSQHRGADHL